MVASGNDKSRNGIPRDHRSPISIGPEEITMHSIKEDDYVILVYGTTGVGKSTFIRAAAGDEAKWVKIGHNLESETRNVGCTRFFLPQLHARVVMVDIPGFDDPDRFDGEVLQTIATWLATAYRRRKLLHGIVYLHRISQPRFDQGAATALDLLLKLYGKEYYGRISIVTSCWDEVLAEDDPEELEKAEQREKELISSVWAPLLAPAERITPLDNSDEFMDAGNAATYSRFDATGRNARIDAINVISKLVERVPNNRPFVLRIQEEMADERRDVSNTDAGRILFAVQRTGVLHGLWLNVGMVLKKWLPRREPSKLPPSAKAAKGCEAVRWSDVQKEDTIIWVFGMAGSGRSTFITHLAGTDLPSITISHDLWTGTTDIIGIKIFVNKLQKHVILVDTPCFGLGEASNGEVLEKLSTWLKDLYKRGVLLKGVIYLQNLQQNRLPPDVLQLFCCMYGRTGYERVINVSSMWDNMEQNQLSNREMQLSIIRAEVEPNFATSLTDRWSYNLGWSSDKSQKEATRILLRLFRDSNNSQPSSGIVLKIQHELSEHGLELEETAAGKLVWG